MGLIDFIKKVTGTDTLDLKQIQGSDTIAHPKDEHANHKEQTFCTEKNPANVCAENSDTHYVVKENRSSSADFNDSKLSAKFVSDEPSKQLNPEMLNRPWNDSSYYSPYIQSTARGERNIEGKKGNIFLNSGYPKPIAYNKRSLIILAIENTNTVNEYENQILRVLNKVVEDNKDSLYLFLRLGNQTQYFDLLDYEELKKQNLPESLLTRNHLFTTPVALTDALTHISNFINPINVYPSLITHKEKQYQINNVNIIFIGTGYNNTNCIDIKQTSDILSILRSKKCINAIKYFCIKDTDAISAAKIGFPVIGHIESNFYK